MAWQPRPVEAMSSRHRHGRMVTCGALALSRRELTILGAGSVTPVASWALAFWLS